MNLDETYLMRGAVAPQLGDKVLQIGSFQERSRVAGPGVRAVVWVAGCLRRCPGCMKPEWFDFESGTQISVDELAAQILGVSGIEGVTLSGGEPFEQPSALGRLCRLLKPSGLNILAYTGYRLEALQLNVQRFGALLSELDYLIDGEYRHDLPGPYVWRGSQNQLIYDLQRGVSLETHDECELRQIQVTLAADEIRITGFPQRSFGDEWKASLARRGLHLREYVGDAVP